MLKTKILSVLKDQKLYSLPPLATVQEAARMMSEHQIGAIPVIGGGKLKGILSERDLTKHIVLEGRDPVTTFIKEIMTSHPVTLPADATVGDAVEMFNEHGYRHLPLVQGEKVIAMLSLRDLYAIVKRDLEKNVREREAFIYGSAYGVAA